MNPIIITISTTAVGVILSIFTANWLNQRFVERMVNQQREETRGLLNAQTKLIDAKLDGLRAEMQNLTARVERLERQSEQRFDRIERQLDAIFKPVLLKSGD